MRAAYDFGMKTLAIITDHPPYPPRNGVTTTVFNYIEGLAGRHRVIVALLSEGNPAEREYLEASRAYYGERLLEIGFERRGAASRLAREVLGQEMYNHGWRLRDGQRRLDALLQADAHLVAPESAAQKYRCLRLPPAQRIVVSINDCVTAEYRYRWKQYGGNVLRRLRSRLDWLRSFRIAGIERRLLSFADVICLQTESDCAHFRHCVGSSAKPEVCRLSNGANPELFALAGDCDQRKDILFVADLSSEHGHWLAWMLREVYPRLERTAEFSRLLVVGRAPSAELMALMRQCGKVEYRGYEANLADVYRSTRVVLSLVFKGYGLITKTLEGMAAGCVVVGGAGAFHGIEGFEDGTHGLVVRKGDPQGMTDAISRCFESDAEARSIGRRARELAVRRFRWEDTFRRLEALLFGDRA